jgi:Cu2+-exporting ATPase
MIEAGAGEDALLFCCVGCEAVYHALHEAGFDDFYRFSAIPVGSNLQAKPSITTPNTIPAQILAKEATVCEDGSLELMLGVDGIHCAGCVWLIEQMPRAVEGVREARLDMGRGRLAVRWDAAREETPDEFLAWLGRFGYEARPLDGSKIQGHDGSDRAMLRRVGVTWALAGNVMLLSAAHYSGLDLESAPMIATASRWLMLILTTIALFYGADVILRRAWAAVMASARAALSGLGASPLSVDVPLALGMLIGWASSAYATVTGVGDIWLDSVAMLIAAVSSARWVQVRAGRAARQRAEQLLAILPQVARRLSPDGQVEEVNLDELAPGELVEVRAGEVCPADGVIEYGEAALQRGVMTGESRLEPASVGDDIEAGVLAADGSIHVRVRAAGDATRLGELMAWIDERGSKRAALIQQADRLGGWFVLAVLSAAALAGIFWGVSDFAAGVSVAVAILVVSCPCALGMATPLALALATGRAAARGIFIKHDDTLEACASADVVIFDKTGTLTRGAPRVSERFGDEGAMLLASALEARSTHPIASAIVDAFGHHQSARVEVLEDRPGRGVRGMVDGQEVLVGRPEWVIESLEQSPAGGTPREDILARCEDYKEAGSTVVMIAVDGDLEAVLGLDDALRPEAKAIVENIRAMRVRPMILSGDHAGAVDAIRVELGMPEEDVQANLTPEEKLAIVDELCASGAHVVMVGDGVNDAAALQRAHVGVAMSGGAHLALAAADVFLTGEGLRGVEQLLEGSRDVMTSVRRNILYALGYNVIGVTVAALGGVTPLIAAIAMPASSVVLLIMTLMHRTFDESAPLSPEFSSRDVDIEHRASAGGGASL